MSVTHAMIQLLGAAALLLWAVQLVRDAIGDAFGSRLRQFLERWLSSRPSACLAGAGVTLALQSSTATALMAGSFLSRGVIGLTTALAVVLGANLGTALSARILAAGIGMAAPSLLIAGFVTLRLAERTTLRHLGRAAVGVGLMLLAIELLVETVIPIADAAPGDGLLARMTSEPLPTLAVTALLTWAAHSSLAIVLVVGSLAGTGLVTPEAALAMVAGANLGSAFNPLVAAGNDRAALRLAMGNLLNRLALCALTLLLLPKLAALLLAFDPMAARVPLNGHVLLNVGAALLFILPLPWLARGLERLLPDRQVPGDPAQPRYLNRDALRAPSTALANAAREALRMADTVEDMLRRSRALLVEDDEAMLAGVRRQSEVLEQLRGAIEAYLSSVREEALDLGQRERLLQIRMTTLNLEHAGDIVRKGLLPVAARRIRERLRFAREELDESDSMHEHLLDQLRLAVTVLIEGDLAAAVRMVEEKDRFRDLEQSATANHFERLRARGAAAMATGALHLDVIRDLRRVEAHLAAIAHPLLQRHNRLGHSRLLPAPKLTVIR
ncbi:MAG: Na/Pi cotransporter family protein [Geminicoccaceae bacterium]